MKAIIYSRVSSKQQNTKRQIDDLQAVEGFKINKVFSEKSSAYSKAVNDRVELQKAIKFSLDNNIECIMIHEISRLGRNTREVLNLIKLFEDNNICIYIHNLGITLKSDDIYSKLIVTIMADLARMESEMMAQRIKSGIKSRKQKGLHFGRKVGTEESIEKFMAKPKSKAILKKLERGLSYNEIAKSLNCSPNTINKVKELAEL